MKAFADLVITQANIFIKGLDESDPDELRVIDELEFLVEAAENIIGIIEMEKE